MLKKAVKKWRGNRGESIAESLVSMLVIVLAGLMLAGAITSSARMNHATRKAAQFPQYADANGQAKTASVSGTLAGGVSLSVNIPVTVYEDEGEMRYYTKN